MSKVIENMKLLKEQMKGDREVGVYIYIYIYIYVWYGRIPRESDF